MTSRFGPARTRLRLTVILFTLAVGRARPGGGDLDQGGQP
jgi:hypothetical protein